MEQLTRSAIDKLTMTHCKSTCSVSTRTLKTSFNETPFDIKCACVHSQWRTRNFSFKLSSSEYLMWTKHLLTRPGLGVLVFFILLGLLPSSLAETTPTINTTTAVVDQDDCYNFPCDNGATCIDGVNTYTCKCPHLYNGTNCEIDLSVYGCAVQPCLYNGTCIDQEVSGTNTRPYRCNCTEGTKGTNCEQLVNECGLNPCQNDAPCITLVGTFQCNCTGSGYTGRLCDVEIDECAADQGLCGNGTCHNNPGSYSCSCIEGYIGIHCQDVDECLSDPCQNGATCVNEEDAYRCKCMVGFNGPNCELDIDNCAGIVCPGGNLAVCVDLTDSYECRCKPGYAGTPPNCLEIDECASNPCKNDAACSDHANNYTCTCRPGYGGKKCDIDINECAINPCLNGASCRDEVNNYTCECLNGYEGRNCERDIDECNLGPTPKCLNNGICIDKVGNYSCSCSEFWTGANCDTDINECEITPPICQYNGTCSNRLGNFQCSCNGDLMGTYYTGKRCEIAVNHCFISQDAKDNPPACKNNGTCRGRPNDYVCNCTYGFKGARCEEINECEPNPCFYNGTCHDMDLNFTCDCIIGTTGHDCSINIDDCNHDLCNLGQCIDGINSYECNCTDTGFYGDQCENNIDDCNLNGQPCQHNSSCIDGIKNYTCSCYQGYTGKNCEIDIDECAATPCHFNSPCFQRSNASLYNIGFQGFENLTFSYEDAAGHVCHCVKGSEGPNCSINIDECVPADLCNYGICKDLLNNYTCQCNPGYEGKHCETEINECERYTPCQNAGQCRDLVANYRCDCIMYNGLEYAGRNCTFELTACQNNLCQMGSTCSNRLIDEAQGLQDYECFCAPGFTGKYCNISSTMSFDISSYISTVIDYSETNVFVNFRFRTTLRNAVLFAWGSESTRGYWVSAELIDGRLGLKYQTNQSDTGFDNLTIAKTFNDALWHTVRLSFADRKAAIMIVQGPVCGDLNPQCTISTMVSYPRNLNMGYFGSLQGISSNQTTVARSQFVGCMQDIRINVTELALSVVTDHTNFTNLTEVCVRTEQCFPDTCNGHGACVDLWNKFRCDCRRPYLGNTCNTDYPAATFQFNNNRDSYSNFTLPPDVKNNISNIFNMSFFVRTRQTRGLILFFGKYNGNDADTFVTLEVDNGNLSVRIKVCSAEHYVQTIENRYADGEQHLVRLVRNSGQFNFSVDGIVQQSVGVDYCDFQGENLLFGGKLPDTITTGRRRRQTTTSVMDINNFSQVVNYKGTIQDVQLGDMSLLFYNLSDPSLSPLTQLIMAEGGQLTKGEQTDPICMLTSPCQNNGTCTDKFFNDYSCECVFGYRGKNCSELDFCVTGKCPDNSQCQSLDDGFECISTAFFEGGQSETTYTNTLQNSIQVKTIDFQFRTYARNGIILKLQGSSDNHFFVEIIGEKLTVEYKVSTSNTVMLKSEMSFNNAKWYHAKINEDTSQVTMIVTDTDHMTVTNVTRSRPSTGATLDAMLRNSGNRLHLGAQSYQGCLREVRMQGILLPFFRDELFINNTSVQKFKLQSKMGITDGCRYQDGCDEDSCPGATQCVPDYYTYSCNCSTGFEGRWCQNHVDHCVNHNCVHGKCVNHLDRAECLCYPGYHGDMCGTDIDECANGTVCENGGQCVNAIGTFSCDCTGTGFTGNNCSIQAGDNCSAAPCVRGTCSDVTSGGFLCLCPTGYSGDLCEVTTDYCANLPCVNGGTCSSLTSQGIYQCDCPTGYGGRNCTENVNDCPMDFCRAGGTCVDGINHKACNCTQYFTGDVCQSSVDQCMRLQPCENSGQCTTLGNAPGFNCDCINTGFRGVYCGEDVDECADPAMYCKNGGTCNNTVGNYTCECSEGYEGRTCDTPKCDVISCQNGGNCQIVNNGLNWKCACPTYYGGVKCEIEGPCVRNPCHNNQSTGCTQNITTTPHTYQCTCKAGWTGQNCSEDIDECVSSPCRNGGTCNNNPGSYMCACANGYTDSTCQTDIDECASSPCLNDGTCLNEIGRYECNCNDTGWEGEQCEVDVNECEVSTPCYNSATCSNSNGSYSCMCPDGYEGPTCFDKSTQDMGDNITWYIVGPVVALVLILITIGVVWFLMCLRSKRATHGVYSPARQEITGSRVELGHVLKKPPLERLI
ncbi:protein crumbs-like isoform X2 [Mya arenaria]|uniref:protein crumbs-like isoform X2 n=1 Tax=Mya arenaria TaxID=6604 RepID=UPI0022E87137|nr:protein crumbs-like isoform X2 [Mya arenaria]XP_052789098.1 protein crumbs-like isoform X2 [Mya arenaria]XP_052789099.1 protein crumbs-like isoform X2 [Mya arenaria]